MISREIRAQLAEHAQAELPNEACGIVVLADGVAIRYEPGTNEEASPYRFRLIPRDPETLFLEDDGYEIAIFHSHISAPPRPSRTDVERIGHWEGYAYLIYTLRTDELAAWRIDDGSIEALPLA